MDPPCTSEGVQCNTSAGTGGAISWGENWKTKQRQAE